MRNEAIMALAMVLLLTLFSCQRKADVQRTPQVPLKAVIKYVDFDVETPIHIDCDSLEGYFGSTITTLSIDEKPFLDTLASIVSALKPSSKGFNPDVRMVVRLYFAGDSTRVLCLNAIVVEADGKEMQFEPKLLALLQSRIVGNKE